MAWLLLAVALLAILGLALAPSCWWRSRRRTSMGADAKGTTPPALTAAQMADTAALARRLVADIVSHLKAGMSLDEYRLALALTTAQARIEAVERERDNWQETAAQHCRNEEFWRGLVHQTGAHFGPAAYTADDGSVGDRVLGLKVPELAQAAVAERDALEARVGFLEGEAERAWQSFSNETTRAEQAEAVREEAQELLGEARSRIEALERERDAAVASRMSDHGILLDAWRDRGEAVPGVDRESTVLRVIRGIHAMRDRAEQAEAELTAALTRLDALVAFLPSIVHEQAQDTEYLVSYIETWRDDSAEFATLAGRMEAERDAARTRAEGLEGALSEVLSGFPYAEILTGLEPDSGEKHLRSYDARATQGQIEKWRAVLATPPPATTGEEPTR